MYMRDLACCANGMAFYSTPSDLVRFALAKNPGSVNGELAGGMVIDIKNFRARLEHVVGHASPPIEATARASGSIHMNGMSSAAPASSPRAAATF